jgi:hypothetical protein
MGIDKEFTAVNEFMQSADEKLPGFASAIMSNVYEGYVPTTKSLALFFDLASEKISKADFVRAVKSGEYA